MDRPAGYLLHKYLRDPYYVNPVKARRRNGESPCSYGVGESTNYVSEKMCKCPDCPQQFRRVETC